MVCVVSRRARFVVRVMCCLFAAGLLVQAVLIYRYTILNHREHQLGKRDETGAIIGGFVGGTIVPLIILSVCFIQMCRWLDFCIITSSERNGFGTKTILRPRIYLLDQTARYASEGELCANSCSGIHHLCISLYKNASKETFSHLSRFPR